MKKIECLLLVMLMLLVAGCADRQTDFAEEPTVPETTQQVAETIAETEGQIAGMETIPQAAETDHPVEISDADTGATPTEGGKCRTCGAPEDDYDGYCYYCHPDHGFHCAECGYYWPEPRPDHGLCDNCAAAADVYTGATG